jgi:hypothetical protein
MKPKQAPHFSSLKRKLTASAISLVCVVFSAAKTSAATVQIDLGTRLQLTTSTGWNNLTNTAADTGFPNPATLSNMVDSTGAATTIDLAYASTGTAGHSNISGTAANYTGTYPSAVSGLPTSALQDGLFFNQTAQVTLTLSDLNPLFTYNFLLYGARGNNGAGANFAVAGLNSDSDSITNVLNNSTETVSFTGIQPTALGVINLTLTPADTSGSSVGGSLNVITITAIPEPSDAVLLSASGMLVLLRRRRV